MKNKQPKVYVAFSPADIEAGDDFFALIKVLRHQAYEIRIWSDGYSTIVEGYPTYNEWGVSHYEWVEADESVVPNEFVNWDAYEETNPQD